MKRMLLVFNPKAGKQEFVLNLYEVIDKFSRAGFEVTVYPTQDKDDAFRVALERGREYDYLVCSGGDGTLNEVACALMQMKHRPLLGYIPSGSTNDYAASLGIPSDPLQAAEVVCSGVPRRIDMGQFGDSYFAYVAAFGLFTDVSYATSQNLKNLLGHMAYLLQGVTKLASIRSYHCIVECDGERLEDDFIFGMVTNSRSVGGFSLPKSIQIENGDGIFELLLLRKIKRFSQLQDVVSALMNGESNEDTFLIRYAKSFRISSDIAPDWTLDGEYGGCYNNVEIDIHRQALELMVPAPAEPE